MLDYKQLMKLAQEKAKDEAKLLYQKDYPERDKKEHELMLKYYRQYTTSTARSE